MRLLLLAILMYVGNPSFAQEPRDGWITGGPRPEVTQQELYALDASGMSSLERWWKSKSIDSDINAAIAKEAKARSAGNAASANRIQLELKYLREKRAVYAKGPD